MRGMLIGLALTLGCGGATNEGGSDPFVPASTGAAEDTSTGPTSSPSTSSTEASTVGSASTSAGDSSGTTTAASTTSEVSTGGSTSTGEPARCPAGHECFFFDGVFHTATEREPLFVEDLPVVAPEFSAIEVEVDFMHGGWYPDDPAGQHNIIWLHRGRRNDFTWAGGVAGYVNTRGPNTNIIRTRHDLDVTTLDDSRVFNINGVALQPGTTYHLFYRNDPIVGEVLVRISEPDGTVVAEGTDPVTTDLIRNNDNGFFMQCGNETDVDLPGPEVPSLGWVFSDMRIEFIP